MEGKYFLYAGAILIVILVIGFGIAGFVNAGQNNPSSGSTIIKPNYAATSGSGNIQTVTLKVSAGRYVLEPSVLKKNVPVRLVADMNNMPGCSKDVVISAFGVRKYFSVEDNAVEFTPDKSGTFKIACSMNMYIGQFSVTDDGAANSATLEAQNTPIQASSGGSCGAGGGGCGCGG